MTTIETDGDLFTVKSDEQVMPESVSVMLPPDRKPPSLTIWASTTDEGITVTDGLLPDEFGKYSLDLAEARKDLAKNRAYLTGTFRVIFPEEWEKESFPYGVFVQSNGVMLDKEMSHPA